MRATLDTARALAPILRERLAGRATVRRRGEVITITDEAIPLILREPDPAELLAPLLGPRVGLRMRRPLARAMAAPFAFRMPSSGGEWVTFAAGKEPEWNARPVLNKADLMAHRWGMRRQPGETDATLLGRALSAAHIRKTFAERDHARFVENTR